MGAMPTPREPAASGSIPAASAARAIGRADARRNRERVLEAAAAVFTEQGLDASIARVAKRAGVGKATVYRSFPTKADLVRALAQVQADWLNERIVAALEKAEIDAYAAIGDTLTEIMTRLAQDRLMVEVLSGTGGFDEAESARHVDRIVELGVAQGALRADATALDFQVLLAGASRGLIELGIRDPEIWVRYGRLALAALRP